MRITEELRGALVAAFTEAEQRRHEYVTLEHMLFALTGDASGRIVLRSLGIDLDALRADLEAFFDGGGGQAVEADSARSLQQCLESGDWVDPTPPPTDKPIKKSGANPRRGADGKSILTAIVTKEGSLTCMRMLPLLSQKANEAVYEALTRWKYTPATNEAGEAIAASHIVPLDFTAW